MSGYLAKLRKLKGGGEPTKATNAPFDASVGTTPATLKNIEEATAAEAAAAKRAAAAFEARRKRVLEVLEALPGSRFAAVPDADADPAAVILALAIRAGDGAIVTCELLIPRPKYDPWLLLALIERHGATVH
jgi:hypothetical protein